MHKLDQPGEDYRPGNQATVSFGVRYEADPKIVPQLQVNVTHKSQDQGALADTLNVAGTAVYLSPGVSAEHHEEHTGISALCNCRYTAISMATSSSRAGRPRSG